MFYRSMLNMICLVYTEDSIFEIPLPFLGGIGANDLTLKTFFCSLCLNGNSFPLVARTKNVTLNPSLTFCSSQSACTMGPALKNGSRICTSSPPLKALLSGRNYCQPTWPYSFCPMAARPSPSTATKRDPLRPEVVLLCWKHPSSESLLLSSLL